MFDPRVHVGAAAVCLRVREGVEEVLLLERARDATHGGGTWGLPGGWVDWGQSPEEAAAREALEEVNVAVELGSGLVVGVATNTYPHDGPGGEGMHVICVAVRFEVFDGSAVRNVEPEKCAGVRWVPVGEVGSLPLFPPLAVFARQFGWL